MKLDFATQRNQIAFFFILLGINTLLFIFFAGFTTPLFFSPANIHSAAALRYINSITQIGILGLTAVEFAFFAGNKNIADYLQINKGVSVWIYGILIITAIVSAPALSWIIEWNETIKLPHCMTTVETWMRKQEEAAATITNQLLSGRQTRILIINLLVTGIIPAVCEELLFRGALLTWLKNRFRNIHIAVFLSAAIFSAVHLQFYGFIPRLLLGLYLGYLFVWTGSIWANIIAHFINNGIVVVAAYLYNRNLIDTSYNNFGNVGNNYMLILLSLVLTSACVLFLYRQKNKRYKSQQTI
jgi:membrane protease YdiL (CAAX protease family)